MSLFDRWRRSSVSPDRWVVVDTETTGLDPQRDHLLAIGAIALCRGRIRPADRFECTVRYQGPIDHDNVLIHGLGAEAQAGGRDPATALAAWQAWAGDAPRFAFHAGFDRDVLRRALRHAGHPSPRHRWLDVGTLGAALHPTRAEGLRSLDDWLAEFDLSVRERHTAGADALATAELLLRVLGSAAGTLTVETLEDRVRRARTPRPYGGGA